MSTAEFVAMAADQTRESPTGPTIDHFTARSPHHRWMTTFGPPDSKSDDDVLEGIAFWDAKAAQYDSDGEPEGAAQCREEAAKYRAEAERRGLL